MQIVTPWNTYMAAEENWAATSATATKRTTGTIPAAAAIISGVEDALKEHNLRLDEAPVSPERLFELLHRT